MAGLDETHSSSHSSYGLDNVHLSKASVHPEQWTLPREWNMEMRETYGVSAGDHNATHQTNTLTIATLLFNDYDNDGKFSNSAKYFNFKIL